MVLGALISWLSNVYVVYTYMFDEKLRRATIATLMTSAAVIAIIFTSAILLQEYVFSIPPTGPCVPKNAQDTCADPYDFIYGPPTWERVEQTRTNYLNDPANHTGGRGLAVKNCQGLSFVVQFTWTASDCFYFMVTIDMMLDLFTSPFGSQRRRMWWYQGIVLLISLSFAGWLVFSGEWGVSDQSILEDFCWNINFGHKSGDSWSWWFIYSMTTACYVMSFVASIVAYRKAASLTQGMRKARKQTIERASFVAIAGAVWTAAMALVYGVWVLESSGGIAKHLNVTGLTDPSSEHYANAPVDYEQSSDTVMVQTFAFIVGSHNIINFLIFRFIVIPGLNPNGCKFTSNVYIPALDSYSLTDCL